MSWLLELGMLMLVARAGSDLFRRLRVNPLVGEIVFGLLLGGALYLLQVRPDAHVLEIFAELGILFMLFTIGLETELKQLMKVGLAAFLVGMLGIALPFVMGVGTAYFWGMDKTTGLFLASALMATSVAATVRVFMDLNYVNNRVSRIVLAAAVIDDILGLLVFSLVLAFASPDGESLGGKLLGVGGFLALLPLLWFAVPRLNVLLEKAVGQESRNLILVAFLLLISFLAGASGLAPIIGAFAFGMILQRANLPGMEHLIKPFYLLLAPVFFLSIGLQMDVKSLGASLALGLVLTLVAVISKGLAAFVGAMIARLPWKEALIVGFAMIPRGEVGLIIAALGRKMNVIDEQTFSATAFMCIATVLLAPGPIRRLIASSQAQQKQGGFLHEKAQG